MGTNYRESGDAIRAEKDGSGNWVLWNEADDSLTNPLLKIDEDTGETTWMSPPSDGGVSNPMTEDLDAGGYSINNVSALSADSLPYTYTIFKKGSTIIANPHDTDLSRYTGTDAKTVINNALNAIPDGSTIYIQEGDYEILGGPITIPAGTGGITIHLESAYHQGDKGARLHTSEAHPIIQDNNSGINFNGIKGGLIESTYSGSTAHTLVDFSSIQDNFVKGTFIWGHDYDEPITGLKTGNNCWVKNCWIEYLDTGIEVTGIRDYIISNLFAGNKQDIKFTGSHHNTIIGNRSEESDQFALFASGTNEWNNFGLNNLIELGVAAYHVNGATMGYNAATGDILDGGDSTTNNYFLYQSGTMNQRFRINNPTVAGLHYAFADGWDKVSLNGEYGTKLGTKVRAYLDGNKNNVSTSWDPLSLTASYDPGGVLTSGHVEINVPGYYQINAQVAWVDLASLVENGMYEIKIANPSGPDIRGSAVAGTGDYLKTSISDTLYLTEGTTIELQAKSDSGNADIEGYEDLTFLSLHLLSTK